MTADLLDTIYSCAFCKATFTREKTLVVHLCEQKRRSLARSEKHVVMGFDAYNRFYRKTQNSRQDKTYDEFARSSYYNAFVKFGSFVSNVNPLYPDRFIDYVVTSGAKLDHWCRDALYDKYVIELVRTETVETALQRSINHMMTWADDHQSQWHHYFHYVSLSRATFDIKDGKISPWLVLNCASGRQMIKKFTDDQLMAVTAIMDVPFWLKKFQQLSADTQFVQQVCKESNI